MGTNKILVCRRIILHALRKFLFSAKEADGGTEWWRLMEEV